MDDASRHAIHLILKAEGRVNYHDLYRRASREAHRMTPFVMFAIRDLIDEGLLVRLADDTVMFAPPPTN